MTNLTLEWTFEHDLCDFKPNQKVKLSRELIEKDYFLICQSQQEKSTPGIKMNEIILPNNGNEYGIEIDGFANNKKSFLWVANEDGKRLITEYFFLPELMGTGKKIKPTCASFRLQGTDPNQEFATISIGILIGGVNPTLNDIFFIRKMRLFEKPLSLNKSLPISQPVHITAKYSTKSQLADNLQQPRRDDGSRMEIGEYALISFSSEEDKDGTHGDLYIAVRKGSEIQLKYLSNLSGSQNLLTKPFTLRKGQIIPIYDESVNAAEDLGNDFYKKSANTAKSDFLSSGDGQIYLYFDKRGYVRWTHSKAQEKSSIEDDGVCLEVDQSSEAFLRLKSLMQECYLDGTGSQEDSE